MPQNDFNCIWINEAERSIVISSFTGSKSVGWRRSRPAGLQTLFSFMKWRLNAALRFMQILQTREESKKKFNDQFMVIYLSAGAVHDSTE